MYKDILLAVDMAQEHTQSKAVAAAVEYAQKFGSRLHIMTVVPDYGLALVGSFFPKDYEKKALEETQEQLYAYVKKNIPSEIQVQHIVGHGSIYHEILHYAEETRCDLIVMASHRPGLEDYLLGPNAARVVRHAPISVLVVR